MKIEFGYGCGSQTLCVPDESVLGVLQQNELALPEKTARELVAEAIAHPIGCPPLREIVHKGEKIAIVTSDITRPLPSDEILPELLRSRAPLRRTTGGSASEMWNFTGSRATAAAPRPSCRASPPVRPSPATTA